MLKGLFSMFKKEKAKREALDDVLEFGNSYLEENPSFKDTDEMLEAFGISTGDKKSVLEKAVESLDRSMNTEFYTTYTKDETLVVISAETEIANEFIKEIKGKANFIHNIKGKYLVDAIGEYVEYCGEPRLILLDCKFMDYRSMLNSVFKTKVELIRLD